MGEFEKIIGYDDIKTELKRFANVLKEPERYAKLGVKLPSGILLNGDPGLGKTLIAKCFIEETGCKVFELRKEKPNGDFVNDIKETFDAAKKEENKPVIVFLDDMDKFANEDNNHPDAEEYVTVQSCIDECKGHGVFVFSTVNDKYRLPDSLLRAGRFDKVIEVLPPYGKDAQRVIEHFIKQKRIVGEIDIEEIAKIMEGKSCAEMEMVINEAGIYAGYDHRDRIDQADIIRACVRMMYDSPENVNNIDDLEAIGIKRVAVHEAGHALIAEVLDPGIVSLVSVCRHYGTIEGKTKKCSLNGFSGSLEQQEHMVICTLGGKAATEMIYGIADIGCREDMQKAFDKVEKLVDDYCLYGFDAFERGRSSNYTLDNKNRLIAYELEKYYQVAKRIIAENREFLDAIVSALIEHKTITYREMQRIREHNFE